MLNALDVEAVLKEADYHCWTCPYDPTVLLFEDDSIFGFVVLFETADQLLSRWKEKQGQFIARMAVELRRSSRKSWNCYAIFLAIEKTEAERGEFAVGMMCRPECRNPRWERGFRFMPF